MNESFPESTIDHENEVLIHQFQSEVRDVFPTFTHSDISEFNAQNIDPEGKYVRLLRFYPDTREDRDKPFIIIIYREDTSDPGFVVNYRNSDEPAAPYTIRAASNSVFNPADDRWSKNGIKLALENAKIQMEGIDHEDPSFLAQPAFWSESESTFLTIGERMQEHARILGLKKSEKQKEKARIVTSKQSA